MEIAMIHVRHLSELATWQFRKFHGTWWVLWPKNVVGCIKTQHPCPVPLTLPASVGQIGSAYSESTSIGITVSSRSFFCGTPSRYCHGSNIFFARGEPNSNGAPGNRAVHIRGPQQFPSQVVHIKKQNRFGVYPEAILLFYMNHLRWELLGATDVYLPVSRSAV